MKFFGLQFLNCFETQDIKYQSQKEMAKCLTENIIFQKEIFETNTDEIKKSTKKFKIFKNMIYQDKLEEVTTNMNNEKKWSDTFILSRNWSFVFRIRHQRIFFDVKVINPNTKWCMRQTLKQRYSVS